MNIGTIIRAKRQQKDLTQEQFAEYMNVSVSAVSQWESGKTTPDFSLIVPLAEFFGISTDELLGRTPGEKEKAIDEYNEKYIVLSNKGEVNASISLWREALARFPGDFHCMNMLADVLFSAICADSNDGADEKAEECVSLCESILRDCKDSGIINNTVQTLVYLYSMPILSIADEKKAVDYALMASSVYVSREVLLEKAYFTEESRDERREIKHQNRLRYAEFLSQSLVYDSDVSDDTYLLELEAALKIWEALIYDGNYHFYHCRLSEILTHMAGIHARAHRKQDTVETLKKALFHAREYDARPEGEQHYTSVIVSAATSDQKAVSRNYTGSFTRVTLDRLKNRDFDFIRSDPEFSALIEQYKTE